MISMTQNSLYTAPCLLLHFDVNGTLILKDTSKHADDGQMLTSVLAENTYAVWDQAHGRMSFKEYVYNILLPGDKSDQALKKERQSVVGRFFEWMEERNHPVREKALAERERIKEKFTDPETRKINFTVFMSFYQLLEKLRANKIPFVIILRTFGDDLKEVTEEIGTHPLGVRFARWGKFDGENLQLDKEGTVDTVSKIFDTFLKSQEHFAIRDNWKKWNSDGERGRSGKPFVFDLDGNRHEVRNLSLFFDDNITGEEKDIVNPVEIHGRKVSGKDLQDKQVFRVNTVQAMLDDDYYVKMVRQAFLQNACQAKI